MSNSGFVDVITAQAGAYPVSVPGLGTFGVVRERFDTGDCAGLCGRAINSNSRGN